MHAIEINKSTADVVETSIDLARLDQETSWFQLARSKTDIKRWVSELKQPEKNNPSPTGEPTEAQDK